jgi:hypothetical protein
MSEQKQYWFKRRRYGYGWVPVTWHGLLSILLSGGIVVLAAMQLPSKPAQPTTAELLRFFGITLLAVINLILISSFTGPAPRWRWGKRPGDNPDEDF